MESKISILELKLGTDMLRTADFGLTDVRVWRVGKPGQDVREMDTIL